MEEQKFLSKYMSGLAPSKKDYYRRSFSESKNYDRCLISTFSQNLSLSLLAPSSWDRVDDPQLAEVVLKPTYCWSCYVADVRERAADQITK